MEKRHNSEAYAIVIASRFLAERAIDLYHSASRNESTEYHAKHLQDDLQALCKALDSFATDKESI